jgi:hypothetical protein
MILEQASCGSGSNPVEVQVLSIRTNTVCNLARILAFGRESPPVADGVV